MASNPVGRASTRRDQIKYVTNTLTEAEFAIKSCQRTPEFGRHALVIQWLLPEAETVLAQLKAGKSIPFNAAQMLPVHALQIVAQDVEYMLMDKLAHMSGGGVERVAQEMLERMIEMSEDYKK